MKVLLINPYIQNCGGYYGGTVYPPLGLLYIAASLKKGGHSAKVLDAVILRLADDGLIELIREQTPDMIGLTVNIMTVKGCKLLAVKLRATFPGIKIVCGGPMPTLEPEDWLDYGDVVVRGEGELAATAVCDCYEDNRMEELRDIPGISYWQDGRKEHNPRQELILDLDALPFPDYKDLYPALDYYNKVRVGSRKVPVLPVYTSRGCPFGCIFCDKTVHGSKFRMRSPGNVMEEIRQLYRVHGAKQVDVLDDNFSSDVPRAEAILDLVIAERMPLLFTIRSGIRVDKVTPGLVAKMKQAKFFKVAVGVETGDEAMMKRMKKGLALDKVKPVIRMFRDAGINVHAFFMVGLPGDTPETMEKTIAFAKEANPHIANFSIALPLPGTELYAYVRKEGKFLVDINTKDGISVGISSGCGFFEDPVTRAEDVVRYYKKAYRSFYLRPGKIADILLHMDSFGEILWIMRGVKDLFRSVFSK